MVVSGCLWSFVVVCGRFFGIYDLYICVCNFLLMFVVSFCVYVCFFVFSNVCL